MSKLITGIAGAAVLTLCSFQASAAIHTIGGFSVADDGAGNLSHGTVLALVGVGGAYSAEINVTTVAGGSSNDLAGFDRFAMILGGFCMADGTDVLGGVTDPYCSAGQSLSEIQSFDSVDLTFDAAGNISGGSLEITAYSVNFGLPLYVGFDFDAGIATFDASPAKTGGADLGIIYMDITPASAVPVPAAAWLFGSAMLGLVGIGRKRAAA